MLDRMNVEDDGAGDSPEERDDAADDSNPTDALDEAGVPTLRGVPLEDFERDAIASLAEIAKARAALAVMIAESSAACARASGIATAPPPNPAPRDSMKELTAASDNLTTIFGNLRRFTPEEMARVQSLTPEMREHMKGFYEAILEDERDGKGAALAANPETAELHAVLKRFRDAYGRAIWAERVSVALEQLVADARSLSAIDQSRLLGALMQSRNRAGSS